MVAFAKAFISGRMIYLVNEGKVGLIFPSWISSLDKEEEVRG